MAQIRVSILDPSGGKKTQVEVPDNVAVDRLVSALVSRMGLPTLDQRGVRINYGLWRYRDGSDIELDADSTFQDAGIQADDVLRLHAEMRAGCFLPGTKVSLADGSRLPIELLHAGAQVLSYDVNNRKLCTGTVLEKTTAVASQYAVINGAISVTPSHLVYADDQWQPVKDIKMGHSLLSELGRPWRVESIKEIARRSIVHNLHLSNPEHTFFAEGVLVHNENAKADYWRPILNATATSRLTDVDRRLLVSEIIDAFEARTLVKIIAQFSTTQKEREEAQGTLLVKPIFGIPHQDGLYQCDVFMIMPFSVQFQSIYEDYVKPVVESFSLKISRGDDFFTNRSIFEDIWSALEGSRFIIADCTGRNANVFYELGIAHTIGKPTILLAQAPDDLPFDIQGRRTIFYEDRSKGLKLLQDKLREAVGALLAAKQV